MRVRLYHRRADGSVKVWRSWVVGTVIHTEWGVKGGKMSHTEDTIKGNSRETAAERVLRRFTKRVEGRKRKGYVEDLDQVVDSVQIARGGVNFDKLPRDFAPAKPHKSIEMAVAEKLDRGGDLMIQRKRDGMRHRIVAGTDGTLRVYSSSNDDVTDRLEPLLEDLRLPPNSILDAELTVTKPDGGDDFNAVSSIARSLPDRAKKMIRLYWKSRCRVEFIVFDCLYLAGQEIWRRKYQERYIWALRQLANVPYIRIVDPVARGQAACSLRESIDLVQKHGWEGLVLWERNSPTVVRVNGSPQRTGCHKWKPVKEDDVIVTGFKLGKGRNSKVVGRFLLAMPDGKSTKPMGKCGTGLDDDTREQALGWQYPCVIHIEYDSKSEKGFRFPVFIRKRDDKTVKDVMRG